MKVNHFNTYPYGGAANAAMRIHEGLLKQQVDSTFLYRINERPPTNHPRIQPVQLLDSPEQSGLLKPIYRKLEKRRRKQIHRLYDAHLAPRKTNQHEVFSMARLPDSSRLNWTSQRSDIVHLHWLAFMADYPSFFESIPDSVPIVWTLHDMSPFTGGCHYASGCERFQVGCGNCPQVIASGPKDVSADSFKAKKNSLRGKLLHVVAPSKWLIDLAQRSPIWPSHTSFSVIHYGLDLEQFCPQTKSLSRNSLQIETDKVVIGFGADDLSNHRKGFTHLIEALKLVSADCQNQHPNIELAVFGAGEIPQSIAQKFKVHSFGFVNQVSDLTQIYSACDFVVVPSLEDNQPQVGLEAMACGRPVIGFKAGGIPEYVVADQTGLQVNPRDNVALSNAIVKLATNRSKFEALGEASRQLVEQEFEMNRQSKRYLELYAHLHRQGSRLSDVA